MTILSGRNEVSEAINNKISKAKDLGQPADPEDAVLLCVDEKDSLDDKQVESSQHQQHQQYQQHGVYGGDDDDDDHDHDSSHRSSSSTSVTVYRHSVALVVLCLCSFTNSFLFMSPTPYLALFMVDLIPSLTTENAGVYAGFMASSLMWGRLLTAYSWGQLADLYGRIRTLQVALLLSAFCSLFFGFSQTYQQAFVWRFGLGMSNAILCLTKIIAYEFSPTDKLERRAMGLVVGMRSWAFLISPAIGGFLSEPIQQYPKLAAKMANHHPMLYRFLIKFPFCLPNLFGAFLCCTAAVLIGCIVPETLPPEQRRDIRRCCSDTGQYLKQMYENITRRRQQQQQEYPLTAEETKPLVSTCVDQNRDIQQDSSATCEDDIINNNMSANHASSSSTSSTTTKQPWIWTLVLTRQHMIVHWMFSFVSTYIDEAFPLFCISTVGGLALTEHSIGSILAGAGLCFTLLQYVTYAWTTQRLGLYPSMMIACAFGTISVAFLPASLLFRHKASSSLFVTIIMAFTKIMHSLYFTSMAVAINKTVPSSQRAKLAGLLLVGNSVGKGLVACAAGFFVAFCFSSLLFPAEYGSTVIWCFIPVFGVLVSCRLNRLRKAMRANAAGVA